MNELHAIVKSKDDTPCLEKGVEIKVTDELGMASKNLGVVSDSVADTLRCICNIVESMPDTYVEYLKSCIMCMPVSHIISRRIIGLYLYAISLMLAYEYKNSKQAN